MTPVSDSATKSKQAMKPIYERLTKQLERHLAKAEELYQMAHESEDSHDIQYFEGLIHGYKVALKVTRNDAWKEFRGNR